MNLLAIVGISLIYFALAQDDEVLPEQPMYRLDLFEGDIAGIDIDAPNFRAGMTNMNQRWSGGIVHYYIDPQFSAQEKAVMTRAFNEYAQKTCIKFVARTNQRDFIYITSQQGCFSHVGRQGGQQVVSLQRNACVYHATVVHELMHAIGFWHEQSRPDRDNFVTINWNNIIQGQSYNFDKMQSQSFNSPYDLGSVMHYKGDAFARARGLVTITSKRAGVTLGNDYGLSTQDAFQINKMYGC